MEILNEIYSTLRPALPTAGALVGVIVVLWVVRAILNRKYEGALELKFRRQVITVVLSFVGLLVIIMALPISDAPRGQLLSLIGILLSAAIALSSTTLLGNAMAGLMLRAIRNFKPGDFVSVGEHFGRVSDRGLFHIEIQTEDRDLTTIPNVYLVTNPVKVSRSSGTIISSVVSLGYDVPHEKIEQILQDAVISAELQEPFVQFVELGDFSVTYKAAGLLVEVKQIVSARSKLRQKMLDKLHQGGVEIVSPTFMNTRAVPVERQFIPELYRHAPQEKTTEYTPEPEDVIFDKAEKAESLEKLREAYESYGQHLETLKESIAESDSEEEKERLKSEMEKLDGRRKRLADVIKRREESKES